MSSCWSEGDLRASLDGELEASFAAQLSVHLAECATCEALRQELAGRALRVAGLMSALEEEAIITPMLPIRPMPQRSIWRSTAAIGAIAAGLAIAALTVSHHATSKHTQDANAAYPNPVA